MLRWLPLLATLLAVPVRADEPGQQSIAAEEPGLRRAVSADAPSTGFFARLGRGPRYELSWHTFDVAEMGGRTGRYHVFAAHLNFYSQVIRLGAGLEGGFDDTPRSNFIIGSSFRAGVQWPTRLTPFVDLLTGVGMLRFDILHDSEVCVTWHFGIEGGTYLYVHPRFSLLAAVGWRRFVVRQPGNDQVAPVHIFNDTLTVRVGVAF